MSGQHEPFQSPTGLPIILHPADPLSPSYNLPALSTCLFSSLSLCRLYSFLNYRHFSSYLYQCYVT